MELKFISVRFFLTIVLTNIVVASYATSIDEICLWSRSNTNDSLSFDSIKGSNYSIVIPYAKDDILTDKAQKVILDNCDAISNPNADWFSTQYIEIETYRKGCFISFTINDIGENSEMFRTIYEKKSYTIIKENENFYLYEIEATPAFVEFVKNVISETLDHECLNELVVYDKYDMFIHKGDVYVTPLSTSKVCSESFKITNRNMIKFVKTKI